MSDRLSDERITEIREQVERWCLDPSLPLNAIPASPDDVFELLSEVAATRTALHRCRADFHAKVIALQAEVGARRAREHALREALERITLCQSYSRARQIARVALAEGGQ